MANNKEAYWRLWQQFHQSTSVDEVVQDLKRLDDLVQSDEVTLTNAYELRSRAFLTLQELTVDDRNRGESLILELLLPHCLEEVSDVPSEVRYAISRYRNCLTDWLNQYPEAERIPLRDKVLDRLRQALKSAEPEGACWTIARIGFRRSDIVQALWKVAKANAGETGDIALSALTSLGVSLDERTQLLSALHQRAVLRCTVTLIGALRRLADPTSVDVVIKHWLQPKHLGSETHLGSLALRVLTDVTDAADTDTDLQDRIWHVVSNLFRAYPDVLSSDLYLGSDVAPRCDSENVVPGLLNWLGKEIDQSEPAGHLRWLLNLRLEQCVRPRQLKGWRRSDESPAIALLRQDAVQDTQHRGLSTSSEMMHKEMAWKTLLCLGCADVLAWYEQGVATETNPYLRQKISELLASFRLDPLPPTVLRWITEPYDAQPDDDSREWLSRLTAVQIAQSAASWEAFEALLNFGLTIEGKVLQKSADALAVVAVALTREGETSIADTLVETVASSQEMRHRLAAASALKSMAAADLLPRRHTQRLASLLYEDGRDPLELSEIVAVLGWLPIEELARDIQQRLQTWALNRDDWLGGRSLETLARRGYLLAQPHLLAERLGLQRTGERWDLAPEVKSIEWAAFIIGLLYLQHSATFTPAIASLLQTRDWRSAVQVIRLLNYAHGKPDQLSLPTEIKEALIARTRQRQTFVSAETGIFRVLARLVPDAMAQQPWDQIWNDWLPDARAALADALGEATYTEPETSSKAVSLLLSLTRDGKYAVRRSAYRGLARQSAVSLEATCFAWSEAAAVELRQRAAEACAWLAPSEGQPDTFGELYQRLAADPEADVRQAVERARHERRDRLWAEEYLSRVRSVEGKTNDEILSAWRYGQALTRVGDDACLRTLHTDLETRTLPPHVRYWFQRIIKDLDEHWRKMTQKWPEPWLTWERAIEKGQGTVELPDGQVFEVNYLLWEQPAPVPSQKHSWGGAVWPMGITAAQTDKFSLQLEDNRKGMVMVKSFSGQVVRFLGVGSYPVQDEQVVE